MTDPILRELSVGELDAALAGTDEQLRAARVSAATAQDIRMLEVARRRLLNEFRRRGL